MRSITILTTALLLGLGGCVTKMVNENCQNRGFSPGSPPYAACYPYAQSQVTRVYPERALSALQAALEYPPPP